MSSIDKSSRTKPDRASLNADQLLQEIDELNGKIETYEREKETLINERNEWRRVAEERHTILSDLIKSSWLRFAFRLGILRDPLETVWNRPVSGKRHVSRSLRYVGVACAAIFISILQGAYFVMEQASAGQTVIAVLLATATSILALGYFARLKPSILRLILIFYSAQVFLFLFKLMSLQPSVKYRLLFDFILSVHAATLLCILVGTLRLTSYRKAALISFSLVGSLLFCEFVVSLLPPARHPIWVGSMASHRELGKFYYPHSQMREYYPDNPRHYFREEKQEQLRWWLRVDNGNEASLVAPDEKAESARVDISQKVSEMAFDVQLNLSNLKAVAENQYALRFSARAASPRTAFVGFSRGHDPWDGLGLYKRIQLSSNWQTFQEQFQATATDDIARIHFDLGESNISVEVSSVELVNLSEKKTVVVSMTVPKYFVDYRFNALGCRGGNYAIPKPQKTSRILVLGDSFAMGAGVHEVDTLSAGLEKLMNKSATPPGQRFEVINCGVSGFRAYQDRKFYELVGQKYQSDVVVLVIGRGDLSPGDSSWLQEDRPRTKFENLFRIWQIFRDYIQKHSTDYESCLREVRQLESELRARGTRLLIVLFRDTEDLSGATYRGKAWNDLETVLRQGLQDRKTPILDLGKTLYAHYYEKELVVHPIDPHPNEIAHSIAAHEIRNILQGATNPNGKN